MRVEKVSEPLQIIPLLHLTIPRLAFVTFPLRILERCFTPLVMLFALTVSLSAVAVAQDFRDHPETLQSQAANDGDSSVTPTLAPRLTRLPDFNRDIYYRNKLEFSLETGWLPNNIPFVFDFLVGSGYTTWPLHYTLVPNIASLRWHIDNIWGRSIFRGNTDMTFSGSYTDIPRGAETRYFAFDYGIRRNFVPRRWRIAPYFEGRGGVGNINAKGPRGIVYAQGQNTTFTLMMGSGARYNLSPRYSVAAGMTYMHVSNFYLSEPKYLDYGINVYGPIVGVYMRLGKAKQSVTQ